MKKLVLFAAVLMVSLFSINNAKAQVSLNINIGSQPLWGPAGYDHVDYYYLPDINAYYYVPSGQYIYSNAGHWISANSLPVQYRNFDLYSAYKVVINEPKPYLRNNVYVARYSKYKNYGGHQTIIRDSRDTKYNIVKSHPNYNVNKNNNRPGRDQKTFVRINQPVKSVQNNGHINNSAGNNSNRPERNIGQRVNSRR